MGLGNLLAEGDLPEVSDVQESVNISLPLSATEGKLEDRGETGVGEKARLDEVRLGDADLLKGSLQPSVVQKGDRHGVVRAEAVTEEPLDLGLREPFVFFGLLPAGLNA